MPLTMEGLGLPTDFGNVDNLQDAFNFIINLLVWIGWSGVLIGVGYAFVRLIFTLTTDTDDSKKFEIFKGELVRAIIIIIIGLLILSAGFIVSVVADLFGPNSVELKVPEL